MRLAGVLCPLILLLAEGLTASSDIPSHWRSRMDSLRQADDLEQWIYAWIDALLEDPPGRYEWPGQARQEIWRSPATADEQSAWFYLLANDGYYQLQHGNIIRSLQAYEEAYRFYQAHRVIAEDEVIEFVLKPLGNNYTRLGDYERAMFVQEQGYGLAREAGDQRQQAAFLINMASTARTAGELEQAGGFGRRALELVPSGTPLQGLLFNTLGDIACRRGDIETARRYAKSALNVLGNPGLADEVSVAEWLSGAFLLQAQLEKMQQHFGEAENYLKQALMLLETNFAGSKQREKAKIWLESGETQFQNEDYATASQSFDHSLSLLVPGYDTASYDANQFYPDNTVLDALTGKARIAVRLGNYHQALDQYRKAMVVSEALRQRFFGWASKQDHQQFSLDIAEEAIAAAFVLYKQTGDDRFALAALDFAERNKARILSDELRWTLSMNNTSEQDSLVRKEKELMQAASYYEGERIQAELSGNLVESRRFKHAADEAGYELSLIRPALYRKYPFLQRQEEIDLAGNLNALPAGVEVWEYFAGNDHWYFFRAGAEGVREFVCLGETTVLQTSLQGFLEKYFNNGPQEMYNDPEGYFRDAFRMYQLLVPGRETNDGKVAAGTDAVAAGTGAVSAGVMIIPDGMLGKIPFEALITRQDYSYSVAKWPFLVRKALLWRAYSLDTWRQLEERPSVTDRQQGFAGFFLAFDEDGSQNIASLPAVKAEMEAIRENINGTFLRGADVSSTAFFEAFSEAATVHLSTHAFLLGEHQTPTLQFADRQVYISDIYQRRRAPELVVLSACQTGSGPLAKGEGIISLAREFAAAGAGGVVAGLWNLNDETAAKLTGTFYRKLLETGDKAGSLHAAKLDWLDNPEIAEIRKLPYHWAALIYSGNNRPVNLSDRFGKPQLLWAWTGVGVAAVSIVAGVWLILRRKRRKPPGKRGHRNFTAE